MVVDDRVSTSMDLYDRAGRLIPGRTQLVSRRASMFAEGVSPVYADRAKGSRFIDVDGNEYIDWNNCVSAVILGHADPVVDGAVKEQIDRGSLYSVNSPAEIELAELLVDTIPSAEMVRYCKGGGEACTIAVKIARGTTGRDKILFSGYHGWHDWYQSVNYLADPDTGEFPIAGIEPIGVPKVLAGTALPFTYGKLESPRGPVRGEQGRGGGGDHGAAALGHPAGGVPGGRERDCRGERRPPHIRRGILRLADADRRHPGVHRRHAGTCPSLPSR